MLLGLHPLYWFAGCCVYARKKGKKKRHAPTPSASVDDDTSGVPADYPDSTAVNPHRRRRGGPRRRR